MQWLTAPWPWYVAGPLIGLIVPLLLLLGNKPFGISSNLRHVCAAVAPCRLTYFTYDWRRERWNLLFIAGVLLGGLLGGALLANPAPIALSPEARTALEGLGIQDFQGLVPRELFRWSSLTTVEGIILLVAGGFAVGSAPRTPAGARPATRSPASRTCRSRP